MAEKILIVDDESAIRFALRDYLTLHGFEIEEAENCRGAREAVRTFAPDAILLDYKLPDGVALDVMPELEFAAPDAVVIVLTAHATIDLAVAAIKQGAEHFVTKPVELAALETLLRRSLANRRAKKRDLARRTRQAARPRDPFVGTSALIGELREQARRVAGSDRPVLVQGETGTGKGVLARWLHSAGPRADGPFVDINCAGLSRELLESELFGHEKGAFTGAVAAKPGLLEIADGGTFFLDEIGDMDLSLQAKLLKVLEEKRFRRVGEVRDRHVDIRLIAATHRELSSWAREEKFRSDLYFRISTLRVVVPPLRSRLEDIEPLADMFLRDLGREIGRTDVQLAPSALERLKHHSWPGNVRELRNVIERALLLHDGGRIEARALSFDEPQDPRRSASEVLADIEREHILAVLARCDGHVERAAERLGIPRSSLYQKLKKFNV